MAFFLSGLKTFLAEKIYRMYVVVFSLYVITVNQKLITLLSCRYGQYLLNKELCSTNKMLPSTVIPTNILNFATMGFTRTFKAGNVVVFSPKIRAEMRVGCVPKILL